MSIDSTHLIQRIDQVLCRDQFSLKRQLRKLPPADDPRHEKQLFRLLKRLDHSESEVRRRAASLPRIVYPDDLPILVKRQEIQEAIRSSQVVVISGETGSGKTTQIPKMCLEIGRGCQGHIACTQPRRIAATSLASRVAKELNTELGAQVGYRIRFSDRTGEETLVHFMTDGILLAEIQSDRFLNRYDTIIIDEAHERTLNIDFLLGYLKQLLPKRPDLKLIITSATIDIDKFSNAFPIIRETGERNGFVFGGQTRSGSPSTVEGAPVIEVSGRMYPVETRYAPIDELIEEQGEITMIDLVREAVEEILTETSHGDILVFMSGIQEIRETAESLNDLQEEGFQVLPLFSRLTQSEQERIFQANGDRKIIVATNIAETSITVPGIRYVIDSGRARISQYNTRSGTRGLPVKPISRSSADQRKGRCGRLSHGICIRLYSEEDYLSRPQYTTPEIQRSDLAEVILRMSAMKLGDIASFPFVDPPESAQIRAGIRSLRELGAIDERKRLTAIGREMASLPLDPRTARMVLQAEAENVLYPVLIIASALSCMDPRERPEDKQAQADQQHAQFRSADSDLMTLLNLWEHYHDTLDDLKTQGKMRKFCKKNFLSYHRMREWRDIHRQLVELANEKGWNRQRPDNWDYDAIHRCILSGYLTHIARKREKRVYEGAKGREILIFPGSGLKKGLHDWIVAVELIETSRLFAHRVARINPEWLESLADHLCRKSWSEPWWDNKTARVVAWEKVTLFGFTIVEKRPVNYGQIDRHASNTVFIREALVGGQMEASFPFLKHNRKLIEEIRTMENQHRRRNILVSPEKMERFYQDRITDVTCLNDLKRLIRSNKGDRFLHMSRSDLIEQDPDDSDALFPDSLMIGDRQCRLHYLFEPGHPEDGVTVELPRSLLNSLQETPFEYLVPGLLQEKILWLLKNLPKSLRKKIFPVQDVADRVWDAMISTRYRTDQEDEQSSPASFNDELSETLFKVSRVYIEPEEWAQIDLPDYLRMNFRIRDPKTGSLVQSRSLKTIQGKPTREKDDWEKLIKPHCRRDIRKWDFGPLLEKVPLGTGGDVPLWGYRCLVKQDDKIILTLNKSKQEASAASRQSITELMKSELGEELSWLHRELRFPPETLTRFEQLWGSQTEIAIDLLQKKIGTKPVKVKNAFHAALQERVYEMVCEGLLELENAPVLTEKAYRKKIDEVRNEIQGLGSRVVAWINEAMTTHQTLRFELVTRNPDGKSEWCRRISEELTFLFSESCLSDIPFAQWRHMARIFKSYLRRIEKAENNPSGEAEKQALYAPFQTRCQELWNKRRSMDAERLAHLKRYRWMLEEFKVSIFSQEFKTAFPVSAKRLDRFDQTHLS